MNSLYQAVRLSWPLLGGALGVWCGFGGYPKLLVNADSFAMVFALGFFVAFAAIGLIVGSTCGFLIGRSVELLLKRLGMHLGAALVVATLVNALALWQIVGLIEAKYPGLGATPTRSNDTEHIAPISSPLELEAEAHDRCTDPPAEAKARELWEAECR